jgi:predicted metal-dependent hydrolase
LARNAPFTEAERMKIRLLHGRQMSATAIAKELKRSVSGVTSVAKSMDLHFDHEQTATATATAAIDMRGRRARIAERLLREAEGLLDDLHRPYMDHAFSQGGDPADRFVQHLAMPTPADKNQQVRAAQAALTEHRKLAEFDAETQAGEAKNMLGDLGRTLRAVADALEDGDDGGADEDQPGPA